MTERIRKDTSGSLAFPIIARILRTVPEENAFYFFTDIGCYTGIRARSLAEFSDLLKTVDIVSIEFHSRRGDYENWFLTTLGDATLAREAFVARSVRGNELRSFLLRIVGARLGRLEKFR